MKYITHLWFCSCLLNSASHADVLVLSSHHAFWCYLRTGDSDSDVAGEPSDLEYDDDDEEENDEEGEEEGEGEDDVVLSASKNKGDIQDEQQLSSDHDSSLGDVSNNNDNIDDDDDDAGDDDDDDDSSGEDDDGASSESNADERMDLHSGKGRQDNEQNHSSMTQQLARAAHGNSHGTLSVAVGPARVFQAGSSSVATTPPTGSPFAFAGMLSAQSAGALTSSSMVSRFQFGHSTALGSSSSSSSRRQQSNPFGSKVGPSSQMPIQERKHCESRFDFAGRSASLSQAKAADPAVNDADVKPATPGADLTHTIFSSTAFGSLSATTVASNVFAFGTSSNAAPTVAATNMFSLQASSAALSSDAASTSMSSPLFNFHNTATTTAFNPAASMSLFGNTSSAFGLPGGIFGLPVGHVTAPALANAVHSATPSMFGQHGATLGGAVAPALTPEQGMSFRAEVADQDDMGGAATTPSLSAAGPGMFAFGAK